MTAHVNSELLSSQTFQNVLENDTNAANLVAAMRAAPGSGHPIGAFIDWLGTAMRKAYTKRPTQATLAQMLSLKYSQEAVSRWAQCVAHAVTGKQQPAPGTQQPEAMDRETPAAEAAAASTSAPASTFTGLPHLGRAAWLIHDKLFALLRRDAIYSQKTLPALRRSKKTPASGVSQQQEQPPRLFSRFVSESACCYIGGWAVRGLLRSPKTAQTEPLSMRSVIELMQAGAMDGSSRLSIEADLRETLSNGQLVAVRPPRPSRKPRSLSRPPSPTPTPPPEAGPAAPCPAPTSAHTTTAPAPAPFPLLPTPPFGAQLQAMPLGPPMQLPFWDPTMVLQPQPMVPYNFVDLQPGLPLLPAGMGIPAMVQAGYGGNMLFTGAAAAAQAMQGPGLGGPQGELPVPAGMQLAPGPGFWPPWGQQHQLPHQQEQVPLPIPQQQPAAKVAKKRRTGLPAAVDAVPQPKRTRGKKAAKE